MSYTWLAPVAVFRKSMVQSMTRPVRQQKGCDCGTPHEIQSNSISRTIHKVIMPNILAHWFTLRVENTGDAYSS